MSIIPDGLTIYDIAHEVQEQLNRYHPQSYPTWSKLRLYEFDCKTRGTKAELEKKRNEFELQLHAEHSVYATTARENQHKQYELFMDALAEEFFTHANVSIPKSVSDRVYFRAYAEGHSGGLRDVVLEYAELSELVIQCIIDCT